MNRRNTLTKIAGLAGATLIGSMLAAAPQPALAKDKVVLMLNWYLYSEHAPFFLGKAQGLFDKQDIELEIQEGRGSGPTVQAVASNTVDFGYADVPTMIKVAAKGAPVNAVGVALQTSPMSVIGLKEKNITKPEDIKGKTLAVTPGDAMSQVWPLFMKKTGLTESDYKTVAGDGQTKLNAVINGQADLLLGYLMDQTMKITDATGKESYAIPFSDYGINMVSSGVIANTSKLEENPDLVRRFMAATTASFEAAIKDPEGAVDAMLAASPKAGKRDTLIAGLKLTTPLYHTKAAPDAPVFKVADDVMADTFSLLVEYGGLKPRGKTAGDFYTNAFLPK